MENVTRRDFVKNSVAAGAVAAAATTVAASQAAAPAEGTIKILAISCSPRQGKSTATALGVCLQAAKEVSPRIETELIELAGLKINGNVAAGIPLAAGRAGRLPQARPQAGRSQSSWHHHRDAGLLRQHELLVPGLSGAVHRPVPGQARPEQQSGRRRGGRRHPQRRAGSHDPVRPDFAVLQRDDPGRQRPARAPGTGRWSGAAPRAAC